MVLNLQLLEATSTNRLTLCMCHGCVYKGSFVLHCHVLYLQHSSGQWNKTSSSLQIKVVYLFSKFSSMGNVYFFFILMSSLMFP